MNNIANHVLWMNMYLYVWWASHITGEKEKKNSLQRFGVERRRVWHFSRFVRFESRCTARLCELARDVVEQHSHPKCWTSQDQPFLLKNNNDVLLIVCSVPWKTPQGKKFITIISKRRKEKGFRAKLDYLPPSLRTDSKKGESHFTLMSRKRNLRVQRCWFYWTSLL